MPVLSQILTSAAKMRYKKVRIPVSEGDINEGNKVY